MAELFILLAMMNVFGVAISIYAVVMTFYIKVIKKSPKSVWQIMGEI